MAIITCPECGNKVSNKAKFCPNCGVDIQKVTMTPNKFFAWLGLTIVFFLCIMWMFGSFGIFGSKQDGPMTMEKFNQINSNMTYADIVNMLDGDRGEILSQVETGGIKVTIVQWEGKGDLGANANVTFEGQKAVSKAQFGLK